VATALNAPKSNIRKIAALKSKLFLLINAFLIR
jgi:hypothetical protein